MLFLFAFRLRLLKFRAGRSMTGNALGGGRIEAVEKKTFLCDWDIWLEKSFFGFF
jgi:hypothetical protein